MAHLVSHWARGGAQVTLLTYEPPGTPSFYALAPGIDYRPLGLAGSSKNLWAALRDNWQRGRQLRAAVKRSRPDVVVSFCAEANVLTLLSMAATGLRVIVSERADPYSHRIGRSWSLLRGLAYRWADAVVVQTRTAAAFFPPAIRRRCVVIPNPVFDPGSANAPASPRTALRLLAVGRLAPQKAFDLLIEAFARVHARHPDWILRIVGEGEARPALEALAGRLGVADRVQLPGVIEAIQKEYQSAGVFVLSSRYEGFPNAMAEAMAAGLPVVAFDCPGSVAEMMQPGRDGLLLPAGDTDALAAALDRIMGDADARVRWGLNARDIRGRFSPARVWGMWQDCLERTMRPPGL